MDINIGSKVRELRKEKKITMSDFAILADVSASMISQIERDLVTPSITVMWKISKALDVNIGYFFEEENENEEKMIVRKEDRKIIKIGNSNRIYEMLVPDLNRKIEFIQITIKGKESKTLDFVNHEGEECGVVIKGSIKIVMNDKSYILNEGDSISFNSNIPHRFENASDEESISIWAMTPPSF